MYFNNIHKSYAVHFLSSLLFFGAITVPYFLDWLRVDYTRIFILQAWFSLWVILFEIPTGIIADKYGRKISLALGVLLCGIDVLMFGLTRNYYFLYLAEFIGALGFALLSGADKALIYDSLIELKKRKEAKYYFSKYEAAGVLGILVSLPLGSLIAGANFIPYPNSLAFTFILSVLFLIPALFIILSMREPKRHTPKENFVKLGIAGLKYLREHKVLRAFAMNSVLISAVTFFIFWLYQPLSGRAGINVAYYGFIGAGFNLFATLLLFNVKRLESAFGIRNILFYSALIPSLLFFAVAITKNVYAVIISILLIAGLKFFRAPILSDFMNRHIESKNRATVLSSISLLERVMIMVMYPIVGFLADITLTYALIFLGVLALIFTFITKIEESHIENSP